VKFLTIQAQQLHDSQDNTSSPESNKPAAAPFHRTYKLFCIYITISLLTTGWAKKTKLFLEVCNSRIC